MNSYVSLGGIESNGVDFSEVKNDIEKYISKNLQDKKI
jgi:hypothetical protein